MTRAVWTWLGTHHLAADSALALTLGLLGAADVEHRSNSAVALAFTVALCVPVAFRRRAPLVIFLVVGTIALAQWIVAIPQGADLAVLVVLYTVAAHRPRALAVAAAGAVQVGVVLAVARFAGVDWPRFLVLLTTLVLAAVLLGMTQQARRSHLAALVDRAERLERERDQQAQLATAAERARIAREMHDIVAHSLSVMIALADGAALTDRPADARSAMRQVASTGREALADSRRVLGVLRADGDQAERAPVPGLSALESLLTAVRATGLDTTLTVSGAVFPVPEAAQNAIFRIVQEALTNTVKHGVHADRAAVRLTYHHPTVVVEIVDNGEHPSAAPSASQGGHGLLGLRERAALFGGHLEAGPGTTRGWRVSATLNLLAVPETSLTTGEAMPSGASSAAMPSGAAPSGAPSGAAPSAAARARG